jgi:hypothetical protein
MEAPMSMTTSVFSSRKGYLVALGCGVFGLLMAGMLMLRLYQQVNRFPRFAVPGETTVELEAGEYVLYAEPLPGAVITNISTSCGGLDSAQKKVELSTPTARTQYSFGAHHGFSLFTASVATSGKTRFQCQGDDKFQLAIGRGLGAGIVIAILSCLGGIGAALYFFIKTLRRRQRTGRPAPR